MSHDCPNRSRNKTDEGRTVACDATRHCFGPVMCSDRAPGGPRFLGPGWGTARRGSSPGSQGDCSSSHHQCLSVAMLLLQHPQAQRRQTHPSGAVGAAPIASPLIRGQAWPHPLWAAHKTRLRSIMRAWQGPTSSLAAINDHEAIGSCHFVYAVCPGCVDETNSKRAATNMATSQ